MALPTPGMSVGEEIREFIQVASDARVCAYCDVACLAWVAYDIVLTHGRERSLIWKAKSSLNKWMFLVLRYFALLDLMFTVAVDTNFHVKYNTPFCIGVLWFKSFPGLLLPTLVAEALMVMRVWALYQRERKLLFFLSAMYICRFGIAIWTCIEEAVSVHVPTYAFEIPVPSCLGGEPSHMYYSLICGSINMASAMTLFLLTLWKLVKSRSTLTGGGMRGIGQRVPLAHLLVRDGSMYFFMVLASEAVFNIFMFGFNGRMIKLAGFPWMLAVYTVAATRVTLNLRESVLGIEPGAGAGEATTDGGTTVERTRVGTPAPKKAYGDFAAPDDDDDDEFGAFRGKGRGKGPGAGRGTWGTGLVFASTGTATATAVDTLGGDTGEWALDTMVGGGGAIGSRLARDEEMYAEEYAYEAGADGEGYADEDVDGRHGVQRGAPPYGHDV